MKSVYTLPLMAAAVSAEAMTEFTPDFVTKSEMELRQFEGFGSVRLLLVISF